jgi:5,5'-dehydrodivanillate O-demethylase oxygenase subunit
MVTREENEVWTNLEPGSILHDLLSYYWYPIAASIELKDNPIKPIRLLGRDFALFRSESGGLTLIDRRCAHRGVDLTLGWVSELGLTCPYHGWCYDSSGQCVDQPCEAANSTFKKSIKLDTYPVEELAGIVFAYVGPAPAPVFPRYRPLSALGSLQIIHRYTVPVNWLQVVENSLDFYHASILHGRYLELCLNRLGVEETDHRFATARELKVPFVRQKYERTEYGFLRRFLKAGLDEDSDIWKVGNPWIFPNMSFTSGGGVSAMAMFVPVDNHTTEIPMVVTYNPGNDVDIPNQDEVPLVPTEWRFASGDLRADTVLAGDAVAFVGQGTVADRTTENLTATDVGVVALRRLLAEQIEEIRAGREPMNVLRDPGAAEIELPINGAGFGRGLNDRGEYRRGAATAGLMVTPTPLMEVIEDLFEAAATGRHR